MLETQRATPPIPARGTKCNQVHALSRHFFGCPT